MLVKPGAAAAPPPLTVTRHPGGLLEARLERPTKLNALSSSLLLALAAAVQDATDPACRGLLLTAAPGRAFCAGGDIREVTTSMSVEAGAAFLRTEYTTMLAIHELGKQKPVISLADGLAFGAGAGLFMSARARVTSSATSLAMPECAIGIVPDTGATDFLGALPGAMGLAYGLTGKRLDAPLMASTGLATHTCEPVEGAEALRDALSACSDESAVNKALEMHAAAAKRAEGSALEVVASRAFGGGGSAAELLESLDGRLAAEVEASRAAGDEGLEAWAEDCRQRLRRDCPASQLVAHTCMQAPLGSDPSRRRAQALGIELEANLALAARPDFKHGVSCAVGELKGQTPHWAHASAREAAADPDVQQIMERVRAAPPLSLGDDAPGLDACAAELERLLRLQ